MARSAVGYAEMVGGPECGRFIYVGSCWAPPPRIDFEDDGRTARYRRCTPLVDFDSRRPRGAGHVGQTTYRFVGYVASANTT